MKNQKNNSELDPPFNYFGGKRWIAGEVWKRFDNVQCYIEPFCGSAAVLLHRPASHQPFGNEIINDLNGLITNAYRAIALDPDSTWQWIDYPRSELDYHARHAFILQHSAGLVEKLRADPAFFDPQIAGWWIWGACMSIGASWFRNKPVRDLPKLTGDQGVLNKNRRRELIVRLSERLRHTHITCGDWKRVVTKPTITRFSTTAIFLDPPYLQHDRKNVYSNFDSDSVAAQAYQWAVQIVETLPHIRIAYCAYIDHFPQPENWSAFRWTAPGGYGNQRKDRSNTNRHREVVFFSPACLNLVSHLPLADDSGVG